VSDICDPSARIAPKKTVKKPWGEEIIWDHNEKYALKIITLTQGNRSSLQSHNQKIETIVVLEGRLQLETWSDDGERLVEEYGPNEAYSIEPTRRHRVTAITDVRIVEASTPELDDVVRYEDDFGRG